MKYKTLAYFSIILVAFGAAILIVNITQRSNSGNSYALSVMPEEPLLLITSNSIKGLADEIKKKVDFITESDNSTYNNVLEMLGITATEKIGNPQALQALLGICPSSTIGYAVLDPTPAATMKFFCLSNKAVFLDYLQKNYSLTNEKIDDIDFIRVKAKTDPSCCRILYIKNDTAFFFENEYYLKKIFKEESEKLSSNKVYNKFVKDNNAATVFIYIGSRKIGEYLSNLLAFAKPAISQQIKLSVNDKELSLNSQSFTETLSGLFDSLIAFFKSQDSICSAVVFDKKGIKIENTIRLKLSEQAQQAFSKPPKENTLIEYIPAGALMVSQDNFSDEFKQWKSAATANLFSNLLKKTNTNRLPEQSSDEQPEHSVFAMYPGLSSSSMYQEINLNYEDTNKYNFEEKEKSLERTNKLFENIEFLLPYKMKFSPEKTRAYNNIKIKQFKLSFLPNEKSIITQMMKVSETDANVNIMIQKDYRFELAGTKNISIFIGDDVNGKFMNHFLDLLQEKVKMTKLIDTDTFKTAESETYSDAGCRVYISVAKYLDQSLKYINGKPKNSGVTNYNSLSVRTHQEGINLRIFINSKDIKEFVQTIKSINFMEKK